VLSTFGHAQNFDAFLQTAIEKSPYLNTQVLEIKQASLKGSKLMRYKNPEIEIEGSRFKPNGAGKDNGYRSTLTQPIRLWGVGNDREKLAEASIKSANANYSLTRAEFIRDLSLEYLLYKQNSLMINLGNQEEEIAKEIYEISLSRFNGGAISRGRMLQSKVSYQMVHSSNEALKLEGMHVYYNLLKRAGFSEEVVLDNSHKFSTISKEKESKNPKIKFARANIEQSLENVKLFDNKIEWLNVFVEFESEPEQDVTRFGVNIPLAVFNTRNEEKQIAKLEAKKFELLEDLYEKELSLEEKRLRKEASGLEKMLFDNEEILKTDLELLELFKKSYKLANANLLELLDIQSKVIETKERLIDITIKLDANTILQNYYSGAYNE